MKLSCQDNMVPGATYREKLDNLARCGYEGMEFQGTPLRDRLDEALSALRGHAVKASTLCAGFRGCLLAPEKAERDLAMGDIKWLLEAAARLEALGLIVVPIFGREPRVPDLSPWKSAMEIQHELLQIQWAELAEHARRLGVLLLLEPLCRYQTHFICRLEQGAEVLRKVNSKGTALMADFFHMNIEETDVGAALHEHAGMIAHVHLSDSNRKLAGFGHTDFGTGLKVLQAAGYNGWLAQEGILDPGDHCEMLARSSRWVREQLA